VRLLALLWAFRAIVAPAPQHTIAWHAGCPVAISDLRLATYWGFDGRPHDGQLIVNGDAVRAFAAVGWRWGGAWTSLKDYQHFSANGG
jgi:hypothetical protein